MIKQNYYGRVKYVQDFTVRDKSGNVVIDGTNILGIMADKKWFRIKNQETTMDEFYNANNRTWQMFLNDVNMYQYSLFCNSVIFATAQPQVPITALAVSSETVSVDPEASVNVTVSTTPAQANTPDITVASSDSTKATAQISGRTVTITGVASGSATITLTAGNVTKTIAVTVNS